MAKRDNHYEAAFEAYLRMRKIPYVAVNEARRSQLADRSIKSLDFIVSCPGQPSWLIDVKGRLFPGGKQKRYWTNWSTRDDLRGMSAWERLFGGSAQALFVFAYQVVGDRSPLPQEQLFEFRGQWYAFIGIRSQDYACTARPISQSWDTVSIRSTEFRSIARPVDELFSTPVLVG
ncbi:MAG: HYExAFE family protein [Planctomycetota bacterium]|nr:HYExAFE family protein [Planctomycetota bacterium]